MLEVSDSGNEDVSAGHKPPAAPLRAMLAPMREVPKQAKLCQTFATPAELSNCIMVSDTQCCIGRRPSGTSFTCTVPETWTWISSCHAMIWWEDGKVVCKDTSSNGTFRGKDDETQESFCRLAKGKPAQLEIGDFIMFSQWANTRANDELLIYRVQALPEQLSSHARLPNWKSKKPNATRPACDLAPCSHCAQQVNEKLQIRKELQSEQQISKILRKDLESSQQKAELMAKELADLRDQVEAHRKLREQLAESESEIKRITDAVTAASKQKDEEHKIKLAAAMDAASALEKEKDGLCEQLAAAKSELNQVTEKLKQTEELAAAAQVEWQSKITQLDEQNKALKAEQELRGCAEIAKLKAEHEAEVVRLQKVQLQLEKEAAGWRLKTETVSRTLPDALEKSMIPQLHKAARQCIHSLLQDVNALNDTPASDLFGVTPTDRDRLPGIERLEQAGHVGPSQRTMCFSSPGTLIAAAADLPQTEVFEGGACGERGRVVPSQEEQGPSVSLRHGFALSQAHTALEGDAGEVAKDPADPASPLLNVPSTAAIRAAAPAEGHDVSAAPDPCAGMTTDETHVSDDSMAKAKDPAGRKRKLSDNSTGDEDSPAHSEDVSKSHKPDNPNSTLHDTIAKSPDAHDNDNVDDRSTSALAERLKALKNQEAIAC
eukprot:jgi/Ulvmu1/9272/UM050_0021.1